MRQREIINTTLGDLIIAVTDEVIPLVNDPSDLYVLASCVVNDLLIHHRRHARKHSRLSFGFRAWS
jgi:hypothetical protein